MTTEARDVQNTPHRGDHEAVIATELNGVWTDSLSHNIKQYTIFEAKNTEGALVAPLHNSL